MCGRFCCNQHKLCNIRCVYNKCNLSSSCMV